MTETYAEKIKEFRDERREKFLDVAAEVLAESGIRKTTMDDIAKRADVSKIVLYRYFGAKDKLVNQVLERVVDNILAADSGDTDWWTERVQKTLSVARNQRADVILLFRHAAHDPQYSHHYDKLQSALKVRIEERLAGIFGSTTKGLGPETFLPSTMTRFFVDAYLRWLETGDPKNDEAFFKWVTRSVRSMSYFWFEKDLPKDI